MFTQRFNPQMLLKKNEIQIKTFSVLNATLEDPFFMIPLTFLYDVYFDRGQNCLIKKIPVEYIVPPPTSGVG